MGESAIEWTDATWNPVRGCVKVSPGCRSCYAETFAERFRGTPGHPYEQGFDPRLVPEKLGEPLSWRKPRRVFVNSMSDLFGEFVPDEYIAAVFGVMLLCRRHTFQVLTKRPERMAQWFRWASESDEEEGVYTLCLGHAASHLAGPEWERHLERTGHIDLDPFRDEPWPLPNVWLGVSVEDRKHGLPRLAHLRETPAALRFLSIEPLLEDLGEINLAGIGWVIVGAESGQRARPMDEGWVRSIRDQCAAQRVPFFYKQRLVGGRKVSLPVLDGAQHTAWPGVTRG